MTDAVWSNMYNNIANVNNIIAHIDGISEAARGTKTHKR